MLWRSVGGFRANPFEISNKVAKGRVSFLPNVKEDAVEQVWAFWSSEKKAGGCNLKFWGNWVLGFVAMGSLEVWASHMTQKHAHQSVLLRERVGKFGRSTYFFCFFQFFSFAASIIWGLGFESLGLGFIRSSQLAFPHSIWGCWRDTMIEFVRITNNMY